MPAASLRVAPLPTWTRTSSSSHNYVSILYMPLGACAAFWSINADYGLTAFGIVTACVAVVTYLLVANLNNAAQGAQAGFRVLKARLVDDMVERSKDPYWEDMGRRFKEFRPNRTSVIPSKWHILRYAVLRLLSYVTFGFFKGGKAEKNNIKIGTTPTNLEDGIGVEEGKGKTTALA
ncbi:hypothetical protein VTG60DRAFT_1500 [Thermothelomyces hinnuleus]